MSGFIAFRISAVACLLVFLYSRAASLYLSDFVIVMDGSSSIGRCEFERGRAAMMNLILARLSKWRRPDEKFAAVTFSNSASVNFKFLPLSAVRQQLRNISYPGGGSNTQAGLEMAKTLFQDSSAGGRVSSEKVVLLITDGQSTIQKQLTIPKANNLKNMGVEIYVVAVGSYNTSIGEMVKVAGSSNAFKLPEDYLLRVHNYEGLWEVTQLMVKKMAATGKYASLSPYPSPC